jgi:hypothetical protein
MAENKHAPIFEIRQTVFSGIDSNGLYVMRIDCPPMNSPHEFANRITIAVNNHESLLSACRDMENALEYCTDSEDWRNKVMGPAREALQAAIDQTNRILRLERKARDAEKR